MFTGRTPFSADTPVAVLMKQVSAPVPIPPKDEVPEAILGPLVKCLAKNPDHRWQSATDFAAAIEKGLGQSTTAVGALPIDAPPLATTVATPRPPARSPSARPVPPPAAASRPPAAPAPRPGGMGMLLLWLGLGLGGVLFIAALVGFWLWQRSQVVPNAGGREFPPPTPVATPLPTPNGADRGTLPVAPTPTGTPVIMDATPAPVGPTPRPTRPPTAAPTSAATPTQTGGVATPPPILTTPVPAAPTAVATPPPPTAPPGMAFRLGERTLLSEQVGPVKLAGATFKSSKPNELETQLEFMCQKGKDQKVTYEVTLKNASGATVLTVKGQQGVEEGDKATAKRKDPVGPGLVDTVRFFEVSFTSAPD
jgi:hypothetical protein